MKYLAIFTILIISTLSYSQCNNNLLSNGSFTGVKGEATTAQPWIPFITPDLNDEIGQVATFSGYSWTGSPLASFNGGTWQNLGSNETVEQSVNLVQGQLYSFCFEYSTQGIYYDTIISYDKPNGINVFIDGILQYTSITDTTEFTWETACFTFVAPAPIFTIKMGMSQPNISSYMAIDGACLTPVIGAAYSDLENKLTSSFYPNPIVDRGTLEFNNPQSEKFTLKIYNSQGQLVQVRTNITSNQVIIERNNLPSGIYFFRLNNEKKISFSGKLTIK